MKGVADRERNRVRGTLTMPPPLYIIKYQQKTQIPLGDTNTLGLILVPLLHKPCILTGLILESFISGKSSDHITRQFPPPIGDPELRWVPPCLSNQNYSPFWGVRVNLVALMKPPYASPMAFIVGKFHR